MASNVSVTYRSGYTPHFSFVTGFRPESEIASTQFFDNGPFDWRYVVTFDDGSGVVFGMPSGDDTTFVINPEGHLILTGDDEITFVGVYGPGKVPGPEDDLNSPDVLVGLAGGGWDDWEGSVFAPDFVEKWLAGGNHIHGQAGTAPDNSILDDQVIHGYGNEGSTVDSITGGGGNDTIVGGPGKDSMAGGRGSDTFIFGAGDVVAGERINGSQGDVFDMEPGEVDTIEARADADFLDAAILNINKLVFAGAKQMTFAWAHLGPRSDGHQEAGVLSGTTVLGDGGVNRLVAVQGEFSDFLDLRSFSFPGWNEAQDRVVIEAARGGNTRMFAPDVATRITGNSGQDQITGGTGDDVLRGFGGNDRLTGRGGGDRLDGGAGADLMKGGRGPDTYIVDDAGDLVDETGGSGTDTVIASIDFSLADTDSVTGAVENLTLSGAATNGTGNGRDNAITGNGGANVLKGLGGKDTLKGLGGNDVLEGGPGGDSLIGGKGKDTATYENAAARVVASLAKPGGNKGEAKGDSYKAVENLTGSAHGDTLSGNGGANVLKGGGGNDRLAGANGNDRLEGGGGADTLTGGKGKDTLVGGKGADVFVFRAAGDSTPSGKGRDVIVDFNRKHKDKIDLEAIDARTGKNNQAFEFIATDTFSGTKGELRFETKAGSTLIEGDRDGDGKADFAIEIARALTFKEGDFVL